MMTDAPAVRPLFHPSSVTPPATLSTASVTELSLDHLLPVRRAETVFEETSTLLP